MQPAANWHGLVAVDLRDEAVRVLRRAVEHVQANNTYAAVDVLTSQGVAWWEEAQYVPAVTGLKGLR